MSSALDEFIGLGAAMVNIMALIPQIILTYNRKTTEGLSWATVGLNAVGSLLWMAYGIGNTAERWLVIVSSVINLSQLGVLYYIVMNIRLEKQQEARRSPQNQGSAQSGMSPVNGGTLDSLAGGPRALAPGQTASTGPVRIRINL